MDAATAAAAVNTTTFEPSFDLIQEDDCNTLLLYLPGFTKEQLRVQLTRNRVLEISGRRPLGNNRWSSFQKDFPVLESCDTNKITAKFEDGILYVRQPKVDKKIDAAAFQPPQKPAEVARPPLPLPAIIDPPPPLPEKIPTTTPTKTPALTPDYKPESTAPRTPPTYPIHPIHDGIRYVRQLKEDKKLAAAAETQPPQKPAEEVRPPLPLPAISDPPPPLPEKIPTPTPTKTPALTPDYKPEITAPRTPPTNSIHPIKEEIRSGERESGRTEERGLPAEGSGGGDRKEKREKGAGSSGGGAAKEEEDNTKLIAESPAARLKAARKKMTDVMLLLVVFALGIYVSKFPWFSKSDQN